jgi:hypothetical protein
MSVDVPNRQFCSALAHAHAEREPLLGTAHKVSGIVALTWPRRLWSRQQFQSRDLPERLVGVLKSIQARHRYYVRLIHADSADMRPQVYVMPENKSFAAGTIDEMADVLANAFQPDGIALPSSARWRDVEEPLVLICTNGARDRCCAKFGFAAYQEADRLRRLHRLPVKIFQSTHLTGDRFAACGLHLPSGDLYGWLRRENVEAFLTDILADRTHLPLFRGNSYLTEAHQIIDGRIRARRRELGSISEAPEWSVAYRTEGDRTLATISEMQRPTRTIGQIVVRQTAIYMFVDCDALDAGDMQPVTREVLDSEHWLLGDEI